MKVTAFLTCEHAGCELPSWLDGELKIPQAVLQSHRGWDLGAYKVALFLRKKLLMPLWSVKVTRLLVEPNRSVGHPSFYSEFSKNLSFEMKLRALNRVYYPFRHSVRKWLDTQSLDVHFLHFSIHTFTPVWSGVERNAQVGLLYDPRSGWEKALCHFLYERLKALGWSVRKNYPYQGKSDGHVTKLRSQYGERYSGVEIELNQSFFNQKTDRLNREGRSLALDLALVLQEGIVFMEGRNEF